MSAPGRPKRESFGSESDKVNSTDTAGRPKHEAFKSESGRVSLFIAPGRPACETLTLRGSVRQ